MKKLARGIAAHLPELVVAAGVAAVAAGAWAIYPPAGMIVGGALTMALGLLASLGGDDKR